MNTCAESIFSDIQKDIQSGVDNRTLLNKICKATCQLSGAPACSLFLPPKNKSTPTNLEIVASYGDSKLQSSGESNHDRELRLANSEIHSCYYQDLTSGIIYCDIIHQNVPVGYLATKASTSISKDLEQNLRRLCYYTAVIYSQQLLKNEVKFRQARLKTLIEFNQLIATGVPLDRLSKVLAHKCAFIFNANAAMSLLLSDSDDKLIISGSFGISPKSFPDSISLTDSLIWRSLKLGGIFSIPDLKTRQDHGLDFLLEQNLSCIHTCTLDVRGDTLGIIVLAYRKPFFLSTDNSEMFEEIAQAAACAIANARSQEYLKTYTEKLEELVELRTVELAKLTEKAEEENRAKSRFVANMSHELRTPLTAIVGYSSVLADGIYGEVNEQQRESLLAISKSSEHLKDLIDEVLNLSKIEAGKDEAEPSKIDLVPLIKQVYKLMLQSAIGKKITLAPLEATDTLKETKLFTDPRHIRQILINLVSNAVKYTPSGGTVRIKAEVVADKVKICVVDTGVGMSDAEMERLFSRFERGEDSYSQEQVGTGIGLNLTKHLVELNGGQIGAESKQGEGSKFWILVPKADTSGVESQELDSKSTKFHNIKLNGLNILVVDDNEATCNVLATLINEAKGKAFTSQTISVAKDLFENNNIDVAIIDLAIPGESGLDLIDYIRQHEDPALRDIPIIVISACVFDHDRRQSFEHGCSAFEPKPFRPEDIIRQIRQLTTANVMKTGSFKTVELSKLTHDTN